MVATRAIINGRPVRAGEIADSALGVTFEGYDPDNKQITFKDKSGATLTKRF